MKKRPNGEGLTALSLVLVIGGIFLGAYGYSAHQSDWIVYVAVGSALFSTGILFAAAATIVHALWFLPGEDEKAE